MEKTMERKKDKWWQRLLMIVAGPLILLLLTEGVIRLLGINTEVVHSKDYKIGVPMWLANRPNWMTLNRDKLINPSDISARAVAWLGNFEEARYIQYKLKPRIDVLAINPFNKIEKAKKVTFRITSNSDGFRTHEFTPKKPGVLRIVTLGDSSTFGWGVNAMYTWQYLLEQRLHSRIGKEVEVFSLGMPGYTSYHGTKVLKYYGWKLEPDLLIISFGSNDARHTPFPPDQVLPADETLLGSVRWTLLKLKTVQLIRKFLSRPKQPGQKRVQAVTPQQYKENLRSMIAEARRRGVKTILLSVCTCKGYTNIMRSVAQSEHVPFVSSLQLFQENLSALKEGRAYKAELAYQQGIYGKKGMASYVWLYVTADGCHPHRVDTTIIADALTDTVQQLLTP